MEIYINQKLIKAKKGETVLEAALRNNIEIPNLCYHSDLKPSGSCRLCVVKINDKFLTACNTKVEPGMKITTNSADLEKSRKINLELIFAQHILECPDCVWLNDCKLLELAKKYGLKKDRFKDRKKDYSVYNFGKSLIFESSKCINCQNCIRVCAKQKAHYLKLKKQDHMYETVPDKNRDCIFCGQCILHCPAGAFEAVGEFEDIEKPFLQNHVLVQIAPSVRASLGEEFGLSGKNVLKKIAASLYQLGAKRVFDVSVGADFTTVEEAQELQERLRTKKNLPLFTSCCPGWVQFVQSYYPEFLPNLTSVKSPHIISGSLIKKYYAQENNIDPKNISVISIMPCVAKKHEIERKELKIDGLKPVDHVLTTRELVRLIKKKEIDFKNIQGRKLDNPLADPSGSGVLYGHSGGVAESALRNIYQKDLKINFKEKEKGIKEVKIDNIRVAVAYGMEGAVKVLENYKDYDFVEVMACPHGCIGGGGQPMPSNEKIIEKRKKVLLNINKKKKIKIACQNPVIKKYNKNKHLFHQKFT